MVFKVEKNRNYTVMSNYHLRDKNLSFKAKGLLSFMLSLPENWDYSLNGLVSVSKESKKAIRTILNELKDNGYLEIQQTRGEKGYYKYEYTIREIPLELEKADENPDTQKGDTDLDTLISSKEIINKKNINKINKTINEEESQIEDSFFNLNNHHSLTKDLVKRGYLEQNDIELGKYDKLFKTLLKDYDFSEIVIINHYIISKVLSRKFLNDHGEPIENKFGYLKNSILNNIDKFKYISEMEWDDEIGWFKDVN